MVKIKCNFIFSKLSITLVCLFIYSLSLLSQTNNVLIGLNSPAYGVKIKTNFPGYNGGWARGFNIVNHNNTEDLISFGALGSASSGIVNLHYGFIGKKYNDTYMVFKPNGNVGVGINTPLEKLHINGSVRGNQAGALRINSGKGYVDIGAKNSGWTHFITDRPRFYFNKEIRVNTGLIGSYNSNLYFRTQGTTRMTLLKNNGNVGIGINSPIEKLHVNGNMRANNIMSLTGKIYLGTKQYLLSDNSTALYFTSNNSNTTQLIFRDKENKVYGKVHGGGDGAYFGLTDGDGNWSYLAAKDNYTSFRIDNSEKMRIKSNGNVGIGTSNPSEKIHVVGSARITNSTFIGNVADTGNTNYKLFVEKGILAEKVRVAIRNTSAWADYVFDDDYNLMPLNQLGNYMSANKHLPNIPTAQDMIKDGLDVATMDAKLLEKIEEAHLYIVELHNEIQELKESINSKK